MTTNPLKQAGDIGDLARTYSVLREIGRGGMGAVVLARHRVTQDLVAIKIASTDRLDPDAIARFAREGRLMARLRHRNIVALYASESIGAGRVGIVMEYVPGESLARTLARESFLPIDACIRIVRDVGRALAHAHANAVVHRDVKPQNVLVEKDTGTAKLADFGISKLVGDVSDVTATGAALGTPAYMSPEQIDGAVLDGRSDVYSLGLLAWELVTGRRPWAGESLFKLLYKQKHESLPAITIFRPESPMGLQLALEGALAKQADARWESVVDMLEQLDKDEPTAAMVERRKRAAALYRPVAAHKSTDAVTIPIIRVSRGSAGEHSSPVASDDSADTRELRAPLSPMSGQPSSGHSEGTFSDASHVASRESAVRTGDSIVDAHADEANLDEADVADAHVEGVAERTEATEASGALAAKTRPSWILFGGGLLVGSVVAAGVISMIERGAPRQAAAAAVREGNLARVASPARGASPSTRAPAPSRGGDVAATAQRPPKDATAIAPRPRSRAIHGTGPTPPPARVESRTPNSSVQPEGDPVRATLAATRSRSGLLRFLPFANRSNAHVVDYSTISALAFVDSARALMMAHGSVAKFTALVDSALTRDRRAGQAYALRARLRILQGSVRDAWTDIELSARNGAELEALALATAIRVRDSGRASAYERIRPDVREALTPRRVLDAEQAVWLAAAVAQVGDTSVALTLLEQAKPTDARLRTLLQDPLLDPVRRSARYMSVVRRSAR